jgi:imidazolonepropionase
MPDWENILQMTERLSKPRTDLILQGAKEVLTCVPTANDLLGRREKVLVAIGGERILAIGNHNELAKEVDLSNAQIIDVSDKIVAPGFVDCHTHVVFGGSRAAEYAARMTMNADQVRSLGIPTGIQSTVHMTRVASFDDLFESARDRLERMFSYGTTTVESKSGYGLSLEKEIQMLRVNRALQTNLPLDIVSTFLGAHDFPPELDRLAYIDLLIDEMLPQVAEENLAEFCDVYCDHGYYSVDETRRILEAGEKLGLRPKIHVDAYADIGGAEMTAQLGAVSADHLNFTNPHAARKLAQAGVIGVVMPALDFAVGHQRPFDARMLMDAGLTLALATDICPGCWIESMQLVIQLACRLYHFSPAEAISAATLGAAKAVGLDYDRGSLEPGKLADLQIWDLPSHEDLVYRLGNNAVVTVIKRGLVYQNVKGKSDD